MIKSASVFFTRRSVCRNTATQTLAAAAIIAFVLLAPRVRAGTGVALRIEWSANKLSFHLLGDEGSGPWVLQHSPDAGEWDDFLFLDPGEQWGGASGVKTSPAALPARDARSGFFRAVQLEQDDRLLREYLAARALWRASGFANYTYEMRWNASRFWLGTVTVIDNRVDSFETVDTIPPDGEPPVLETVDGLFDMIANARANHAETIQVTWHREFGYPVAAFIDQSSMIADEEYGWTINSFSPPP